MSTQETFETSIRWWSLEFNGQDFEGQYREARRTLKRVPKQTRVFFVLLIITVIFLVILDIMTTLTIPGYNYGLSDLLTIFMYIPIFSAEYIIYKCECISFLRGTLFTVVMYPLLFLSTLLEVADKLKFPTISPT